jgi:hypothetical protein
VRSQVVVDLSRAGACTGWSGFVAGSGFFESNVFGIVDGGASSFPAAAG